MAPSDSLPDVAHAGPARFDAGPTGTALGPGHPPGWGRTNWRGLWTLYRREMGRVRKWWKPILLGPCITALLYLSVFLLAAGEAVVRIEGLDLKAFILPGLILQALVFNAFMSPGFAMMFLKLEGTIVDEQMAPLSPLERTFGHILPGATAGLLTGLAVAGAAAATVGLPLAHPLQSLGFAVLASLMLAAFGTINAIWAESWDQLMAISGLVVVPLSFLSGTFYALDSLPPTGAVLVQMSPLFYAVTGLRGAMTGTASVEPWLAALILTGLFLLALLWVYRLFRRGYRMAH